MLKKHNKRINVWTNKAWLGSCLTNYSQALLAGYAGVVAVELLFFKKNSLFYGFQMHYLML
ncbi:hypothetical protein AMS58_20995 [Pseudoalteromonas porphyrae]|nr:hypothetical protein AMS58_20995 [Pseudoalteromonas porphyrae]